MKKYETKSSRTKPGSNWPAGLTKGLLPGLALLCLLMLPGCSQPRVVTQVQTVKLIPPEVLLLETPEPRLAGNTNAALLDYALELRAALRAANTDKAALRAWVRH